MFGREEMLHLDKERDEIFRLVDLEKSLALEEIKLQEQKEILELKSEIKNLSLKLDILELVGKKEDRDFVNTAYNLFLNFFNRT